MSDGRWLTLGALAGLIAAASLRSTSGSPAARKKAVKAAPASTGGTFPVDGIPATLLGPIQVRALVKSGNTCATGDAPLYQIGENLSKTLTAEEKKADYTAMCGPETHLDVWRLDEFPGAILINTEPVGGVGGYRPLPERPGDRETWWVLIRENGAEEGWFAVPDDAVVIVALNESAVPGWSQRKSDKEWTTEEKDSLKRIFARFNTGDRSNTNPEDVDRFTASLLPIWKAERKLFPPKEWKISGYGRGARGDPVFAYSVPGDPWALDWTWPESAAAAEKGAVRKVMHRSRVPVGRKSALTLEGVLDPKVGFRWTIRGAFEFFSRDEKNKFAFENTGGFPSGNSWGSPGSDEDKGLLLFRTAAGWKAAVGFGWTFMRLVALLGGDRMDGSGQKTRAVLREILHRKGPGAWRAWYELALGDRREEAQAVEQQHEIRPPGSARQSRSDGFISRPGSGRASKARFPVEIPAYEFELEALVDEASSALGRGRAQQTLIEQQEGPKVTSPEDPRIQERLTAQRQEARQRGIPFDEEMRLERIRNDLARRKKR